MYTYKVVILRWVDGDTVKVNVDLGFGIYHVTDCRLLNVDTPERNQPLYKEARLKSESIYPVGSEVIVTTHKGSDKYGRWLIDLPLVTEALTQSNLLKVK